MWSVCPLMHYTHIVELHAVFIDCGNTTHKKMHVLFRGDARMVYAPADPLCIAAEVEPAHFIIDDAMTNVNCNPIVSIVYFWGGAFQTRRVCIHHCRGSRSIPFPRITQWSRCVHLNMDNLPTLPTSHVNQY